MNRFDKEAKNWDKVQRRVELAKSVSGAIKPFVKESDTILEFGCGSGLVGLELVKYAKKIVGIDTSCKMVEVFNQKAKEQQLNAKAYCKDIFEVEEKFDKVVASMVLHHIKDIAKFEQKLYTLSNELFIADLLKEDGSFHDRGNEGVYHFGFSKEELQNYFHSWSIEFHIIHTIKKQKSYPVFLAHIKKCNQA